MKKIYKTIDEIEPFLINKQIAIFDFDGTIANTEIYHLKSYCLCLKNIYNINLDDKTFKKFLGHKEIDIYKMIENDFNIKIDYEYFMKKRTEYFFSLIKNNNLKPNKFFIDFVNKYKNDIYLLTSQRKEIIEKIFKYLNIDKYFKEENRLYTTKGFTKTQVFDHPEIFLNSKNVNKDNIVIFEDVKYIIDEAQNKGYTVISILHNLNSHIIDNANLIISTK